MVNPQALTPGELSTGDPTAADAAAAVSVLRLLSLTLAAPLRAQQSLVAVNAEGTLSFGPYAFIAKLALNSIGLYCHLH